MRQRYRQDITYWNKTAGNSYGEPTFASPVVFKGHWEERNEQVMTPSGQVITSQAMIFVPTDQDVEIGGYLALGDQSAESNPLQAGGLEVQALLETPSLRTNQIERHAIL